MHYLIDILPIIVIVMLFWGCNYNKEFYDSYLAKDVSNSWKGILAIIVLLHHISQRLYGVYYLYPVFKDAGFLAVAAFFFFSGYGLQKQRIIKGVAYKEKYFRKRVVGILIPYAIVVVLQWLNNRGMGNYYPVKAVFNALFVGDQPMMVMYSWYVLVILGFYILYGVMQYLFSDQIRLILAMALLTIIYCIICIVEGIGTYWFNTTHLLILGMIGAQCENKIVAGFKKCFMPLLICSLTLLLAGYSMIRMKAFGLIDTYAGDIVLKSISALAFVAVILLLNLRLKIGNKLIDTIGKISLEIYLMQGIFVSGLGYYLAFNSEEVWGLAIIISTLIGAIALYFVDKMISKNILK